MIIDLNNPAVAFLFFGGLVLWTLFAVIGFNEDSDWAMLVTMVVTIAMAASALVALGCVIHSALTHPTP